tara:strand:- start:4531 stop:5280 length:750 start_codon:yes stop_codon:yes gene_type:complete
VRVIARLDIKGPNLIKGLQLEGLRVIGDPNKHAIKYYNQGADELLFIDCVASLYGRNNLIDIINHASKDIFIPVTVGGGIRKIEDAEKLFLNGADKIAINSAAVRQPSLINDLVKNFGSQAVVVSIQAKKIDEDKWNAYLDNGRENSGKEIIEWLNEATSRGAGEILVTSVDNDGTKKGFDLKLYDKINKNCNLPLIISGGMGKPEDLLNLNNFSDCNAVAAGTILHYDLAKISEIKEIGINNKINGRD